MNRPRGGLERQAGAGAASGGLLPLEGASERIESSLTAGHPSAERGP